MDRRLKDIVAGIAPIKLSLRDRQEHLAMLARWFYSSWREGEWISIPNLNSVPYRKIMSRNLSLNARVNQKSYGASHCWR